ncbi:MAG TPA: sterol desaturase family protein [Actinomycetota bacterium]|nr:sterol desaturase family protein [Actinomycetota bacterium]
MDPVSRLTSQPPAVQLVVVLYSVTLALVAAEVAWLAREPGPRRRAVLVSAAVASTMGLGAVLVGFAYAEVLESLWGRLDGFRWEAAARYWARHPLAGWIATFVAWDLAGWIYHVIGHRTTVGWAAHQPHHSGTEYDASLGLRQTWVPFHGLLIHPLLALLGFDLEVAMVCAAASNSWQVLEHTSLDLRFPRWFAAVVMTPAAHRHHHGVEGNLVNLGPFLTIWDRLSGTWVSEDAPAPERYGLGTPVGSNPLRIELAGWMALLLPRRPAPAVPAGQE